MTLEDAKKWACLLQDCDDHIVAADMINLINEVFPEFEFTMGWGDDYGQVSVVEK